MKSTFKRITLTLAVIIIALAFSLQSAFASNNPIRIIRDEFGVPHVYAKNVVDLYFGYGYVTAEDRLFQIEMLRRSVQGRVAEVLGPKFIELDKVALRDGYSLDEIGLRMAKLSDERKAILEAFAGGINKRIGEVEKDRRAYPAEFTEMGFNPSLWSAADVASIFVGTMAVRYSDFTAEMDNMNLLKFLTEKHGAENAKKIFDDIVPLTQPLSTNTIAAPDFEAPAKEEGALKNGMGLMNTNNSLPLYSDAGNYSNEKLRVKALLKKMGLAPKNGSYFYAISSKKSKNNTSILANGPQMGFFNPAYLYEAGLHCPEFDIIGTTTPCYMNMMFGMNGYLAFGATAGVANLTDVYIEKLNPKNPDEYMSNGEYIKFEKREFKIKIKGRRKAEKLVFLKSIHGPVFEIDKKSGVAYSKKRAWEYKEIDSMFAWMEAMTKKNFSELKKAISNNFTSINIFASNRQGELFYYLCGLYPVRKPGSEERLPLNGDGSFEWSGFLNTLDNPSGKNAQEGFIANWNARPFPGFTNGDLSTGWGPDQRTYFLRNALMAKDKFDINDMLEINKAIGYADVRAAIYAPLIIKQLSSLPAGDKTSETAIALLSKWNFERRDDDGDGFYDSPAVAFFDALWPEMMSAFFADALGEFSRMIDSDPTWTQSGPLYYLLSDMSEKNLKFDYTKGQKISQVLHEAVIKASAKLSDEYKTGDASKWLKKSDMLVFDTNNFTQVPQTSADNKVAVKMVNRGTENHFVELGPETTIAMNINPPGQSGFYAANEKDRSKHAKDQLELFDGYKGYKPMRFNISDIIRNKTSEKFIFMDNK
ncbi:MAG TPA: penicillin acylase family protein [Candidatus Wallbacteria bacterium]|nr:penicillin acylase family protein [Candidatus Wallbacteria bacterium]